MTQGPGNTATPDPVPAAATARAGSAAPSVSVPEQHIRGATRPCQDGARFRTAGMGASSRQTAASPAALGPPRQGPVCRAPRQPRGAGPGRSSVLARLEQPRGSWTDRPPIGAAVPKRSQEGESVPRVLGVSPNAPRDAAGPRPRRCGTPRRRRRSSDGGARKRRPVAEGWGGAAEAQPRRPPWRGPSQGCGVTPEGQHSSGGCR